MKVFLILILFFSFRITAFAQADSGFTNKAEATNQLVNGVKEGKWIEYLKFKKDSQVEAKSKHAPFYRLTIYKAGKPEGIMREYYKNGKLWSITPYDNGVIAGVRKVYTENGDLMLIDTIENGKENGIIKLYYKSGKVMAESLFTNDTAIKGNSIINIPLIQTVLYNVKITEDRGYYEDGHLESDWPYVKVRGDVIMKEYYDSGVLKSEIPYTNGQLNGIDKDYDANGKLESETPFVDGKITGVVKHYYENGKVKSEATFMQNELVGTEKLYNENGNEIK